MAENEFQVEQRVSYVINGKKKTGTIIGKGLNIRPAENHANTPCTGSEFDLTMARRQWPMTV
jgi:hypothetical protein